MKLDYSKIEKLLGQVFDELQTIEDQKEYAEARRQFIFHMIDWIDDLQHLIELYQQEQYKGNAVQTVASFLYHVIPHINAAGRLALDHIPDSFTEGQK